MAAHLETEILLVDEVLAVGDAAFQKKCLGKIGDAAGHGRTVLFVSHNMLAVDSLCTRAICMDEGRVILEGSPGSVNLALLKEWLPKFKEVVYEDIETAPGNELFACIELAFARENGASTDEITVRTPFLIEFEYWKLDANADLVACAQIFNEHGLSVFTAATVGQPPTPSGLLRRYFFVPADFMNIGTSECELVMYFSGSGMEPACWEDVATFEVHDVVSELRGEYNGEWPGVVRPRFEWKTELLEPLPVKLTGTQKRANTCAAAAVKQAQKAALPASKNADRNSAEAGPRLLLLYHHVGPSRPGIDSKLTLSPQRFEQQMRWLARRGYAGVKPSDWLRWIRGGEGLPEKPILLTFDDAYADTAEYGLPIVRKYGFSCVVFVVTERLGGTNAWDQARGRATLQLMTAEQIRHWAGPRDRIRRAQ